MQAHRNLNRRCQRMLRSRPGARFFSCLSLLAMISSSLANGPEILWSTNVSSEQHLALAVSPDGARIAAGAYGRMTLWSSATAERLNLTTDFRNDDFNVLAFSPDGTRLMSGGGNQSGGVLRYWDPQNGTYLGSHGGGDSAVISLAISSDSQWYSRLTTLGNYLTLDSFSGTSGGTSDEPPPGDGSCVTFSPTAKVLVTGGKDGSVTLWSYTNELSDNTILATYTGQAAEVTSVVFLPDGSRFLSLSGDDPRLDRLHRPLTRRKNSPHARQLHQILARFRRRLASHLRRRSIPASLPCHLSERQILCLWEVQRNPRCRPHAPLHRPHRTLR
jgi:WD40 repeat protein